MEKYVAKKLNNDNIKILGLHFYEDTKITLKASLNGGEGYSIPVFFDSKGFYILLKDYFLLDTPTNNEGLVYQYYLSNSLLQAYIHMLEYIRECENSENT
jgi:hypothetical protein